MATGGGVFVVDDDPDIRNILGQLLELQGYAVRTAANGREALEKLAVGSLPRVILLDLMMPVMSGWEFRAAQLADARLAAIPVVVLTGGGQRGNESQAVRAAEWLAKPVDLDRLLETVARHAGGSP